MLVREQSLALQTPNDDAGMDSDLSCEGLYCEFRVTTDFFEFLKLFRRNKQI